MIALDCLMSVYLSTAYAREDEQRVRHALGAGGRLEDAAPIAKG
jgi:hypothetical protein